MLIALTAVLLVVATAAWAQSPVALQVRSWATRYHEDLPRIDRARAELGEIVKTDPQLDNLVALAQVCFIWGDIRAKTPDEKLDAYEQGREAARRAIALDPRNVLAHF